MTSKNGRVPLKNIARYSNGRVNYADPDNKERIERKREKAIQVKIKPIFFRTPGKTISAFS